MCAFIFQVQLSEDTFGPNLQERGEREKRLFDLKKLGVAGLGVKAVKAVGAKAVAAGAAAIKAKFVKAGAAAKAVAASAVGFKAKAIGAKTITAIAVLGIKTFLFNLLFGVSIYVISASVLCNNSNNYLMIQ